MSPHQEATAAFEVERWTRAVAARAGTCTMMVRVGVSPGIDTDVSDGFQIIPYFCASAMTTPAEVRWLIVP